jgi:hypothetical protein
MARPVSDGAGPQHAGRRRLILLVIAIAQLMVVLDSTVVNIALPSALAYSGRQFRARGPIRRESVSRGRGSSRRGDRA